jgi:maltose/moltooligosaccharide transporter
MEKRKLSFWQIWNMSFWLEFKWVLLCNSNVSRIFQTLGANIDDIPILWVRTYDRLIIQPIIGYFSDRLGQIGRRKPYF